VKLIYTEDTQQRLDAYLSECGEEELLSRSFIAQLIAADKVLVNGKTVKKSHKLEHGDTIEIVIPPRPPAEIVPQDIPIDIRYEDDDLVIVNKPAGLTVHPAPGNPDGTLVNGLMHHFDGKLSSGSHSFRPGIVHRLDKETSGLLIVAKTDVAHVKLTEMFQNRQIDKYYKAIVCGVPQDAEFTIEQPIDRSKTDRKKMAVLSSGRDAITHCSIQRYFDFFSLLNIKLETGRTHQIRVHCAFINNPILGDETYNSPKRTLTFVPHNMQKKVKYLLANRLHRQALHAWRLSFVHPITQKLIEVESALPDDMQQTLAFLERNFITR
jgi:23S rRNA pseudouridine1911/1915/1917 synthase